VNRNANCYHLKEGCQYIPGFNPGKHCAAPRRTACGNLSHSQRQSITFNAHWKGRDSGFNSEPEDTGGTYLHRSPGVGVSAGNKTRLYGFVQIPICPYINGVQLTADWSIAAGLSRRF